MEVMRTSALWICGLLASAIFGAVIGSLFVTTTFDGVELFVALGAALAFTCARLWMTEPHSRAGE